MMGTPSQPGMTPRAVQDMFALIREMAGDLTCSLPAATEYISAFRQRHRNPPRRHLEYDVAPRAETLYMSKTEADGMENVHVFDSKKGRDLDEDIFRPCIIRYRPFLCCDRTARNFGNRPIMRGILPLAHAEVGLLYLSWMVQHFTSPHVPTRLSETPLSSPLPTMPAREQETMFIVRMSYVELYNNRFRNLLSEGSATGSGDGGSVDAGDAVGFGSSIGSGRGSWREAADGEVMEG